MIGQSLRFCLFVGHKRLRPTDLRRALFAARSAPRAPRFT
jgi:hypothetical protein